MRISDWSSDVCSSDLGDVDRQDQFQIDRQVLGWHVLGRQFLGRQRHAEADAGQEGNGCEPPHGRPPHSPPGVSPRNIERRCEPLRNRDDCGSIVTERYTKVRQRQWKYVHTVPIVTTTKREHGAVPPASPPFTYSARR